MPVDTDTWNSLERLERTVGALLDRLGEGPTRATDHESNENATAQTTSEAGDTYKDAHSSAAPMMVIRDLATDTGVRPSSDSRPHGALLDDLIAPGLALTLIQMYADTLPVFFNLDYLFNHRRLPSDFVPVFSSIMGGGFSSTRKVSPMQSSAK
ncbi:hypothetical protein NUU61_007256 [Penicillium alfredii]|uniref:Uncharacterized protein n=1 Tax=Penicillium alfredii TaxID=1506179 RepID=A0A9W9K4K1_9EURO|nr:uncharacterized protein NUU61_007256 [Penicillium alfredii]KAJ5092386.1 hypothetical protein NUU61_007256 [Penicillium alfredii]